MKRALAGHGQRPFAVPPDVNAFAHIDRDTGEAATPTVFA